MLPLRYMRKNPQLAKAILENWDHDAEGLDEAFQSFHVYANAVYPFPKYGKTYWLRFAPEQEKGERNWHAEMAFLEYLQKNGFPCAKPVPSKNGNLIESVSAESGSYLAAVFEQAPGQRLDTVAPTEALIRAMGETVGQLHKLAAAYKPEEKPWGHESVLNWCIQELKELDDQENALWEATQLSDSMDTIHKTKESYGFIHFDLTPENLFAAEDGTLTVIDFEDCMLNWYACDLDIAAGSLNGWLRKHGDPLAPLDARMAFLNGYRTQYKTPGRLWAYLPQFRRFDQIYKYTRIVRAIDEPPKDEPEDVAALRGRLEAAAADIAMTFRSADLYGEKDMDELED